MPNIAELASRIHILEQKIEKLSPTIAVNPQPEDLGLSITGVRNALGVQLVGLTTAQRTTLGVSLATLPTVKHILVFDNEDQTYYTWSGTEWV